jgi:hypothetical protein
MAKHEKEKKKLCKAIESKRCGMLTSGLVLHHDNIGPDTAACTQALLEHFSCKLLEHPPYSPDITSSSYHLFTYWKNWLVSQHFSNNEQLMEGVKNVVDLLDSRRL